MRAEGCEFAQRLLKEHGLSDVSVVRGNFNHYNHGERVITLTPLVYKGSHAFPFIAHEIGHAIQDRKHGWIAPALRWLVLGNLLLEWDASRRAKKLFRCTEQGKVTLNNCWRTYLLPALWQTGAMIVIGVIGWLRWK